MGFAKKPPSRVPSQEIPRFYDWSTEGRAALDKYCIENGLRWGIVEYGVTGTNGTPKIKAKILIGTLYEIDDDGDQLDPLLAELAKSLSGE